MSLLAASLILSTFASESPLTLHSALLVVICIPLMVQIPTDFSFLMSATLIPCFCNRSMSWNKDSSSSWNPGSSSTTWSSFIVKGEQQKNNQFPAPLNLWEVAFHLDFLGFHTDFWQSLMYLLASISFPLSSRPWCTLRPSTVSLFISVLSGTAAGMVENRHLEGLRNPSKSRCLPRRDGGDNTHLVGSH